MKYLLFYCFDIMALKGIKLDDLKVADLKRELEERDLDTSGSKTILKKRLKEALLDEGLNPDDALFETDLSKLSCKLEENSNALENKLASVRNELVENSNALENKLASVSNNLVSVENKLLENSNALASVRNELLENSNILENKLASVENKLLENSNALENRLFDSLAAVENKIFDNLESELNILKSNFDEKVNSIETELVKRIEALETRQDHPPVEKEANTTKATQRDESREEKVHFPTVASSVPAHNVVPVFDGKMPWEDFKTLFETAAMVHGWSQDTKASTLCLALRGDALAILQAMPLSERYNYEELVKRLEMRFGHKHMEQVYRSQLRNRTQKSSESLQEFEADVARLVRNAYSSVTDDIYESLAVDKFLDGLREPDTQQAVKLTRPKTLSEALTQALEFEAIKQSVRGQARVRAMEAEQGPSPTIEDIVKKVLEALKSRKKEVRCWSCGEMGHLRSRCKAAKEKKQEN